MELKQRAKDFIDSINWKRASKVAVVILPVLVWEVWYNTIKVVSSANEKINSAGDKFLSDFMNK